MSSKPHRLISLPLLLCCAFSNFASGVNDDYLEFREALQRAKQGDAFAQAVVAMHYQLGWQTEKNFPMAAKYAIESANAGEPLGQYRLGELLIAGEGVIKNVQLGQNYLSEACKKLKFKNDIYSKTALGSLVNQGKLQFGDVFVTFSKAVFFLEDAASTGFAPAQHEYAILLKNHLRDVNDLRDVRGVVRKERLIEQRFLIPSLFNRASEAGFQPSMPFCNYESEFKNLKPLIEDLIEKNRGRDSNFRKYLQRLNYLAYNQNIPSALNYLKTFPKNVQPQSKHENEEKNYLKINTETCNFEDIKDKILSETVGYKFHCVSLRDSDKVLVFEAETKDFVGAIDIDFDLTDDKQPPTFLLLSACENFLIFQKTRWRPANSILLLYRLPQLSEASRIGNPILLADRNQTSSLFAKDSDHNDLTYMGPLYKCFSPEYFHGNLSEDFKPTELEHFLLNDIFLNDILTPDEGNFKSVLNPELQPVGLDLMSIQTALLSKTDEIFPGQTFFHVANNLVKKALKERRILMEFPKDKDWFSQLKLLKSIAIRNNVLLLEFSQSLAPDYEEIIRSKTVEFHKDNHQPATEAIEVDFNTLKASKSHEKFRDRPSYKITGIFEHSSIPRIFINDGKSEIPWPFISSPKNGTFVYADIVEYTTNPEILHVTISRSWRLGVYQINAVFTLRLQKWLFVEDTNDLSDDLSTHPTVLHKSGNIQGPYNNNIATGGYRSYYSCDNSLLWYYDEFENDQYSLLAVSSEDGKIKHTIENAPLFELFAIDDRFIYGVKDPSKPEIEIVSRDTLSTIATLVVTSDLNLMFISPDGYYFATTDRIKGFRFSLNDQIFPFENYDIYFNRPDILLARLGYPANVIKVAETLVKRRQHQLSANFSEKPHSIPMPEIASVTQKNGISDNGTATLQIRASDMQAPLRSLFIFNNKALVNGPFGSRLDSFNSRSIDSDFIIPLSDGKNHIQVAVRNSEGVDSYLKSLIINNDSKTASHKTYLVCVGVSKYSDPSLNLNYAAKDAQDVNDVFKSSFKGSDANLQSLLLTDNHVTKDSFAKIQQFLAGATINDSVIIFLAGHGFLDNNLNYIFGTSDVDVKNLAASGISFTKFEELLTSLVTPRKLLLMDTCHAGEVYEDQKTDILSSLIAPFSGANQTVATRGMNVRPISKTLDQLAWYEILQRGLPDVRRASGATVISSSSATEAAFESSAQTNGLFTSALLKALRTASVADLDADGSLKVSELTNFLKTSVSEMSKNQQAPTVRQVNLLSDFPVLPEK